MTAWLLLESLKWLLGVMPLRIPDFSFVPAVFFVHFSVFAVYCGSVGCSSVFLSSVFCLSNIYSCLGSWVLCFCQLSHWLPFGAVLLPRC